MRAISKKKEPVELSEYHAQPGAVYDGPNFTPVKDRIRETLLAEQGYLCAYCMQRIDKNSMKMEHWHCRSRYPEEQLQYQNLLACCEGEKGQPAGNQHCDTKKGNRDISFNPANPDNRERMKIHYLGDGRIRSEDETFDREINECLNLNWTRLKENRKSVWKSVTECLSKKTGKRSVAEIRAFIQKWNRRDAGKFSEYCDVAIYYLEKKLRQS